MMKVPMISLNTIRTRGIADFHATSNDLLLFVRATRAPRRGTPTWTRAPTSVT